MFEEIFRKELGRDSVFKDPAKLSPEYLPEKLVGREEESRRLVSLFRPLLEGGIPCRVLVTGRVGVGKTALSRRFGMEAEREGGRRGVRLSHLYLNCRGRTPYSLLLEAVRRFSPGWPERGVGKGELLSMLVEYLKHHSLSLLLILDEVDYLIERHGPDLLYSLSRVGETTSGISLLSISRDQRFLGELDEPTRATFLGHHLELPPYTKEQLVEILRARREEAFRRGALPEESLELAAEMASRTGDARMGIELLLRAGVLADGQGNRTVLPEHVRAARASLYPELRREVLLELSLHELLLLLAAVRRLKKAKELTTGELRRAYEVVCEEHGERPRHHSTMLGHLRRLEALGILEVQPATLYPRGQTQRIGLEVAPAAELEKEVELRLGEVLRGSPGL
ncbi:MAG: AAA family ATPase, partial [Candidatus Hadarchaeales archaeon]